MIQRLRRNFILIASGCVLFIIAIVLACLNGVTYYSTYSECMSIMDYIAQNNGRMPDRNPDSSEVDFYVSREIRFETRYFSMVTDEDGRYIASDDEHINAISEEDMEDMFNEIFVRKSTNGILIADDSYFLYRVKDISGEELSELPAYSAENIEKTKDTYKLVLFMDCTNRFYRLKSIRILSLVNGVSFLALFIALISFFSERAVRPFVVNYQKQKQFITNAGHELKTPLAIISANAEVVEAMHEKSEWTDSIRHQVERMTGLINDLIAISKLDEMSDRGDVTMEKVDFSALVKRSAEDFKTVALQQGKSFDSDIAQDLSVSGSEKMLKELVSILLDNAIKYCDDGGSVKVTLKRRKNKATLVISNTCEKATDCTCVFDRFYRGDTSHSSEKSGYGIGLSMAQAIVNAHKGKIDAKQIDGVVYMTVSL